MSSICVMHSTNHLHQIGPAKPYPFALVGPASSATVCSRATTGQADAGNNQVQLAVMVLRPPTGLPARNRLKVPCWHLFQLLLSDAVCATQCEPHAASQATGQAQMKHACTCQRTFRRSHARSQAAVGQSLLAACRGVPSSVRRQNPKIVEHCRSPGRGRRGELITSLYWQF